MLMTTHNSVSHTTAPCREGPSVPGMPVIPVDWGESQLPKPVPSFGLTRSE